VPAWLIMPTGGVLALFSGFCFVVAVWRELMPEIAPKPQTQRLPAALLIAVNGFLLLVSLAAFVGLLFS
jgi:putative membrane protein